MCIHPRCWEKVSFRLLKTPLGDQAFLCAGHAQSYLERFPTGELRRTPA